jgi:2'-phosphotransferase
MWNDLLTKDSPCYGVIVFKMHDDPARDKCTIVTTPAKLDGKGRNSGFPKGKIKKILTEEGKVKENIFEGAARELEEETGLKFSQLTFANDVALDELSNKGNVCMTYLVAKYIDKDDHVFTYDNTELSFSGFMDICEAQKVLWKERQGILNTAYSAVANIDTQYTTGDVLSQNYMRQQLSEHEQEEYYQQGKIKKLQKKSSSNLDNKMIRVSKKMSWILRHGAKEVGLTMDSNARVLMSDFLNLNEMNGITLEDIMTVVENNDKKRFEVDTINGNLMIYAKQGHNKSLDGTIDETKLLTKITTPLDKCIHGTNKHALKIIERQGLAAMSRMHIHLAVGEPSDNAVVSGARESSKVLIYIDMERAMCDGMEFYMSENGVVLTRGINGYIEPKYFKKIILK